MEFFSGDAISASCVACMSMTGFVLPACWLTHDSVDADTFVKYAAEYLLPELNEFVVDETLPPNPNSFLVLDNVSMHHDPRFLELLKAKRVRYHRAGVPLLLDWMPHAQQRRFLASSSFASDII